MDIKDYTFEGQDRLSLKRFCEDLERFIFTERKFVEGSLVVSLNAPFGSGKSTFLAMWRNDLLRRRKEDQALPFPILLNAWQTDHCGDPLLGIVSGLISQIDWQFDKGHALEGIRNAIKDVAWMGLGLANSFVAHATGLNAVEAGTAAEKRESERKHVANPEIDLLASFETRVRALNKLQDSLSAAFKEKQAFVLVDELDRCRPDYAVDFLEAIKHVFLLKEVTFVLAVDKEQLCSSARSLFGSGLNFDEYYRKFAHRNISLPQPTAVTLSPLVREYLTGVIVGPSRPTGHSYANISHTDIERFEKLALGLKMTPRQLHEMCRIYGHIMSLTSAPGGELFWGFNAAALLMAGLSVAKPNLYRDIGNQTAKWSVIAAELKDIFGTANMYEWWMTLLVAGNAAYPNSENLPAIVDSIPKKDGLPNFATAVALSGALSQFSNPWGFASDQRAPFVFVYEKIEKLTRFGG